MKGELAERPRLWVRSPRQPIFRNALEHATCGLRFLLELLKQSLY
jgi:hypothetical protein